MADEGGEAGKEGDKSVTLNWSRADVKIWWVERGAMHFERLLVAITPKRYKGFDKVQDAAAKASGGNCHVRWGNSLEMGD